MRLQLLANLKKRMPGKLQVRRTICRDDQHPHRCDAASYIGHDICSGRVGPVHVVQEEYERTKLADYLDETNEFAF